MVEIESDPRAALALLTKLTGSDAIQLKGCGFQGCSFQGCGFQRRVLHSCNFHGGGLQGRALVDPATAGAVVLLAMSALFITSRLLISDFFFMVPSSILFNPDDQLCHVHDSCQTMNTVKTPLRPSTINSLSRTRSKRAAAF